MDIPSIETFLIVARKQSFSQAADSLYLTQPAVSKRIAALESELNCQLFDRIKKKTILTEAGRIFLPRAQQIVAQLKESKNELAEIGGIISGELVMATSHHIGLHYLPPVLKQYVNEYPQVDLNLDFMESESACLAVENAEIELAVITLPNEPAECLKLVKIWSDPLKITMQNDHPLIQHAYTVSGKKIFSIDDVQKLIQYPAILSDKGTYTRVIVDEFLAGFNLQLQEKLSNNFLETIKMMVSVGLGWSLLPQTLIDETLTQIEIPGFGAERNLGIATHKSRTLSQAAQKMVNLLTSSQKNKKPPNK